jgi:hypothetical protein
MLMIKSSFSLSFEFVSILAIIIQQIFWILCSKCSDLIFENQFQWNSFTFRITSIYEWKKGFHGEKSTQRQGYFNNNFINLCTTIAKWVPLGRHKSPLGECKQGTMMKRIGM